MSEPVPESDALAVEVIGRGDRAASLLNEHRLRLIESLDQPRSPAELAKALGLPRQRVNYHLKELERRELVRVVEERSKGAVVERKYQRSAATYVISGAALGSVSSDPAQIQDRFSASYQIALASRAVQELGSMQQEARDAGKKLPTLSLDVDVRFASAESRNAFAEELVQAVADLCSKYQDDSAPQGRSFRFYLGGYPTPKK